MTKPDVQAPAPMNTAISEELKQEIAKKYFTEAPDICRALQCMDELCKIMVGLVHLPDGWRPAPPIMTAQMASEWAKAMSEGNPVWPAVLDAMPLPPDPPRELTAIDTREETEMERLERELVVECERAMRQRDDFLRTGKSTAGCGGSHDTCFGFILRRHITKIAAGHIAATKLDQQEIINTWEAMPGGHSGFMKHWGYLNFAQEIERMVHEKLVTHPTPVTDDALECLRDVVSHHGNFASALGAMQSRCTDKDDVMYWAHELKVLHRMCGQARQALDTIDRRMPT